MMRLFILIACCWSLYVWDQTHPVKMRKHGKHPVYLDRYWKQTEDSTKAIYLRYTHYDNGVNLYPMGPCGKKGYTLMHDSAAGFDQKILHGVYRWYNRQGVLSSVHRFEHGVYVSCEEYDGHGDQLRQKFDFTQKCSGEYHGWTVYIFDRNGTTKEVIRFCKDKSGKWPLTRG